MSFVLTVQKKFLSYLKFLYSFKIIVLINRVSNVGLLLGSFLTAVSATGSILDEGSRYKHLSDEFNWIAAIITLAMGVFSFCTQVKINEVSGRKEKAMNLKIIDAHIKLERQRSITENYRLEHEKLKSQLAWRELTIEQITLITNILKGIDVHISIIIPRGDPEAMRFGRQVKSILEGANKISGVGSCEIPDCEGLWLIGLDQRNAFEIQKAFAEAGVIVRHRHVEPVFFGGIVLNVGWKEPPHIR